MKTGCRHRDCHAAGCLGQASREEQRRKNHDRRQHGDSSMPPRLPCSTRHAALQIHWRHGLQQGDCRWTVLFATRKITEIYEGTSEIQRIVIARKNGLR